MALFGLGFGLLYPSLNTQVAAMFPADGRGRAYGIFNAFYTLGVVVAPPADRLGSCFALDHVGRFRILAALALAGRGGAVRLPPLDGRGAREGRGPPGGRLKPEAQCARLTPEPTADRPADFRRPNAPSSAPLTGTSRSSSGAYIWLPMTSVSPGLPLGRSRRMVNLTAWAGSKAVKVTMRSGSMPNSAATVSAVSAPDCLYLLVHRRRR